MKMGFIGTSDIMRIITDAVKAVGGFELSAIYSRDARRGRTFADSVGIDWCFDNYEEMLKSDIEVVCIASPNFLHAGQAIKAMEAGKHVIVEKPAAVTKAEAEAVILAAKENNVFFFEAITTLYMPNYLWAKERLSKIGKIKNASISFGRYSSKYDAYLRGENPNIFNPEMKAGALNDMGIYCVHVAADLFGRPEEVEYKPVCGENGIDLEGVLTLSYKDFTCIVKTAKNTDIPCGFLIEGEKGYIKSEGDLNVVPNACAMLSGRLTKADAVQAQNRMVYEFEGFYRAIYERDTGFFEKAAHQSKLCAEILEKAHM